MNRRKLAVVGAAAVCVVTQACGGPTADQAASTPDAAVPRPSGSLRRDLVDEARSYPDQWQLVSDGHVTKEDQVAATAATRSCVVADGVNATPIEYTEDGLAFFRMRERPGEDPSTESYDRCYANHQRAIDRLFMIDSEDR